MGLVGCVIVTIINFADIICEWPLALRLVGLSAVNALVGCLGCFLPRGERFFLDDDDEVLMTKEGDWMVEGKKGKDLAATRLSIT